VNDVLSLSEIIDFLLSVMRDPDARAEFEQDPEGAMARAGIEGATGQDVRDAQLVMADRGMVRSDGGGGSSGSGGDDPVQEINFTTRNFQVTENAPNIVNIDDRDVFIRDSFNSDDDVTIIDDSFNKSVENDVTAIQDNDTIIEDNDTINVEDNDTVVDAPATTPAPDPVAETEAEPVLLVEAAVEPEQAPDEFVPDETADDTADVDAAAV
jgi:hypothetical protein